MINLISFAVQVSLLAVANLAWGCSSYPGDDSMKEVISGNTAFAFNLYHELVKEESGNLFFSPYSITNALVMTAEGARSETALEMGEVLQFPAKTRITRKKGSLKRLWNMSPIRNCLATINKRLAGKDPKKVQLIRDKVAALRQQRASVADELKALNRHDYLEKSLEFNKSIKKMNDLLDQIDQYEIRLANALWGEQTYPFAQPFLETINKYYKTGGVFPVDFKLNYEETRQRINRWVEEQTNQRIKGLLPEGAVNKYTRLILTNAIYFKGEWATTFKKERTEDKNFTLADGSQVTVPLMHAYAVDPARYAAFNADGSFFNTPKRIKHRQTVGLYPGDKGFAIVELPYKGDEIAMVVIAPNKHDGLLRLESEISADRVEKWLDQMQERKVQVFLPKFKLETGYDIKKTLQQMGMIRAFKDPLKPHGAQFYGMTTSDDPLQQLFIAQILHKAFVEVNEKGTEAVAATGVIMVSPTMMPATVPFIPTFRADRPFIFLIHDRVTGSILFMG